MSKDNSGRSSAAMPIYSAIETVVGGIDRGIRGSWTWFRDGPLHHFVFWLVLFVTMLRVVLTATFSELDRFLSKVERWFIAIAMLVMTALSFLDYLRREIPGFEFEVQAKIDAQRHGTIEPGTGKPKGTTAWRAPSDALRLARAFALSDAGH